jgi:competence protein ComGC
MLAWLNENWINILVLAIVAVLLILAIVKIIKDRKSGIMACGQKCEHCHCNCSQCDSCCYTQQSQTTNK